MNVNQNNQTPEINIPWKWYRDAPYETENHRRVFIYKPPKTKYVCVYCGLPMNGDVRCQCP